MICIKTVIKKITLCLRLHLHHDTMKDDQVWNLSLFKCLSSLD